MWLEECSRCVLGTEILFYHNVQQALCAPVALCRRPKSWPWIEIGLSHTFQLNLLKPLWLLGNASGGAFKNSTQPSQALHWISQWSWSLVLELYEWQNKKKPGQKTNSSKTNRTENKQDRKQTVQKIYIQGCVHSPVSISTHSLDSLVTLFLSIVQLLLLLPRKLSSSW